MKHIFISYRRTDSSFLATKIRDRLEQTFPGQVFLDVLGIDGGVDFSEKLKAAVSNASVVLALVGHQWFVSSNGQTTLGQDGDFVTEEIGMALESGIPIIPILVDGVQMPSVDTIPVRLKEIGRFNAIPVTHIHFDSDIEYVVAAVYAHLGIKSPSKFEKFCEALSFGQFKINVRTRERIALFSSLISFFFLALIGFLLVMPDASKGLADQPGAVVTVFVYGALLLFFNLLGLNALRRRKLAIIGTITASITVIGALLFLSRGGAFRQEMPFQPWLDAQLLAVQNFGKSEIPSDQLNWQPYPPPIVNMAPFPTVHCECVKTIEKPMDNPPYPERAFVTIQSSCDNEAVFLVARSEHQEPEELRWIVRDGHQFVVVQLSRNQSVRIPVEHTYGISLLPWRCL